MFTVYARVAIRIRHSLQDVNNEDCHQFAVSWILTVFAGFCHGFSTAPGKNSFCHGKNPTLVTGIQQTNFLNHFLFPISQNIF